MKSEHRKLASNWDFLILHWVVWRKKENRKRIMDEKTAENITTPLTEREKKLLKYIHIRSLITRIFCVYFINLNYLFLMHTEKRLLRFLREVLRIKERNN